VQLFDRPFDFSGKGYVSKMASNPSARPQYTLQTSYPSSYPARTRRSASHSFLDTYLTFPTGSDPETIDTGTIPSRYETILRNKTLLLGGHHRITYDMDRDMLWRWDQVLKTHPNGMRFSCFGEDGDLLATNEYFSVGGGFVVNEKTKGI
jgi:hypothetical protein